MLLLNTINLDAPKKNRLILYMSTNCSKHNRKYIKQSAQNTTFCHSHKQTGGKNIFSSLGNIVSQKNNKLNNFMDKAYDQIDQVSRLTDKASEISSQISDITSQVSNATSFDSNFTSNELAISQPLGTVDNFQSFGDYVCIKKSFLDDLRRLLFQLLADR